jgi:hypothetical protein
MRSGPSARIGDLRDRQGAIEKTNC